MPSRITATASKVSWWRGEVQRILCLDDVRLEAADPATRRVTSSWPLSDVISASVVSDGAHRGVLLLDFAPACLCGIRLQQRFVLASPSRAAAMAAAVCGRLMRTLTEQDSEDSGAIAGRRDASSGVAAAAALAASAALLLIYR